MSELRYEWITAEELKSKCIDLTGFNLIETYIAMLWNEENKGGTNMKVFFECDGMGCEKAQKIGKCPSPDGCRMTTDAKHAANFIAVKDTSGELYVFERKSSERDTDIAKKIIDAIEDTTWYHIGKNGALVSGANSDTDEPLYKANDIFAAIISVVSEYDEEVEHDR